MVVAEQPTTAERIAALRLRVRELARDSDDAFVLSELVAISQAIDALEHRSRSAEA